MPKLSSRPKHFAPGFTLVEMIGVLAIIAILIALLLPKVFSLISSSNARALAAELRTYEIAVVNYYSDIGTLYPIDTNGVPAPEEAGNSTTVTSLPARLTLDALSPLNTGANQWKRFRGPYLEKFNSDAPPGLGTLMLMPTTTTVTLGTTITSGNIGWDLRGDDGNSDLPSGTRVTYLQVEGVSDREFLELDSIIDPGVGNTVVEQQLRGRVKYSTGNDRLLIYLAHQ